MKVVSPSLKQKTTMDDAGLKSVDAWIGTGGTAVATLVVPVIHPNFFFSSRRRHTILTCDWSSDVCYSDLSTNELTNSPHRNPIREAAAMRQVEPKAISYAGWFVQNGAAGSQTTIEAMKAA